MIDLYQFSPAFDVPNLSPFCMKLEAFLRVCNIPFQVIDEDDPSTGPKGKLPYIRDNGVTIGDSELVIDYLESKLDFRMDGHLGNHQAAIHHTTIRMLEDHLYWAILYSRWIDEHNWPTLKHELFYDVPPPFSTVMAGRMRKRIEQQLHAHGMGRHNRDEVYAKGCKDIRALSAVLGDHTWFGGDYVAKLDLVATGMLCNILIPEMPNPLADCVRETGNLEAYATHARRVLFPDPVKKPKRPQY